MFSLNFVVADDDADASLVKRLATSLIAHWVYAQKSPHVGKGEAPNPRPSDVCCARCGMRLHRKTTKVCVRTIQTAVFERKPENEDGNERSQRTSPRQEIIDSAYNADSSYSFLSLPAFLYPQQVLEALPWEPMVVLKSVALGGAAILLSPVADRLVVSPTIHLWAQARIKSMSSS